MKIPFLAASAAAIAMLGACSGAPAGLDPSAPTLGVFTTGTTTTTSTDSTSTCTTLTDSTTSTDSTISTTTSTQLSVSGTYAVAYGGAVFVIDCTDSP